MDGIIHTVPVIVLCHVPIQAGRGDNNGAVYWNEALNYAATGVEGITTTGTSADIIRNVLFLHGHNHTIDPTEYYYGAGTEISVQVDNSSAGNDPPEGPPPEGAEGEKPPAAPRHRAEGVLSDIYYTSLTAGYLKTSGNATLVTAKNGELTLTKYNGGETVSLGTDGASDTVMGDSITIAEKQHIQGQSVRENVSAPACEHGGSYDLAVYCTICGQEMSRTQVVTEPAGHSWGAWILTRNATESMEGEEERLCSVCGKTETRSIPMLSPVRNAEIPLQGAYAPGLETAALVQTGDDSQCVLWFTLMWLSLYILMLCCGRAGRIWCGRI